MTFKLYELSDAINRVATMMEEGVEGLEDTLESLDLTFQDKVESIVKLMQSKIAEYTAINAEADRLKERANRLAKDIDWLENYVETEMKRANVTEVKSLLFKIKLNMTPPRVEVTDKSVIPEHFMRVTLTSNPDKMAIKEALQRGEYISGVELRQDLRLNIK